MFLSFSFSFFFFFFFFFFPSFSYFLSLEIKYFTVLLAYYEHSTGRTYFCISNDVVFELQGAKLSVPVCSSRCPSLLEIDYDLSFFFFLFFF